MKIVLVLSWFLYISCDCYKILALFPNYARSHHIFFSSLMETLAMRHHDVTVLNHYPMKKLPALHQIRFEIGKNGTIVSSNNTKILHTSDAQRIYSKLRAYKTMANLHCRRLIVETPELQRLVQSGARFDVVIVEQFVSDCGLAIAHMLKAPAIGITAHILLPWTHSRLGLNVNPLVPNYFFALGSKPNLYNRIRNTIINFVAKGYYKHAIQKSDQDIVNAVYPEVPNLEVLGKNIALIMVNQYYALTGSHLYGANVVEIGGMHVNETAEELEEDLKKFLDSADLNGTVYISFGSIIKDLPQQIVDAIITLTEKSKMKFVWKSEITNWTPPENVLLRKWLPQIPTLCHPNVKAFISHLGMLSTTEAIHCGVPVVGVPLFSDEFANGQAAVDVGLGVVVDGLRLDGIELENALNIVLQESYQRRAKELSRLWKDRPMSPMDTAVFWIEHVARHKGAVNLTPPTVELPLYQYLMIDVILVLISSVIIICLILFKMVNLLFKIVFGVLGCHDRFKENVCEKKII